MVDSNTSNETSLLLLEEWKSIARLPYGATITSQLSLLSPYTWWRVSVLKNHRDFIPNLLKYTSALLIPLVGTSVYYLSERRRNGALSTQQSNRILHKENYPWYILSTYALACIYKIGATLNPIRQDVFQFYKMRSQANPPAWECLADRITTQRAYRTSRYDVYVPPPSGDKVDSKDITSILFLPGSGVEHTAYAELCSLLSDEGYYVVVVSMEPLRLADGYLAGSNVLALQNIMKTIQKKHYSKKSDKTTWVLMGHSLGSLASTKLVGPLGISKLVMLASAPFVQIMGDISSSTVNVQVIQGSNDIIIDTFATPELTQKFWKLLPPRSQETCQIIEGGTHSGFSNYTSWWKPELDGIPIDVQHKEAIRLIVKFLKEI